MNSATRFAGCDGLLDVRFEDAVLTLLSSHKQVHFWQRERGGLVFAGDIGAANGAIVISAATGPHRRDKSGRYWLVLDPERCRSECDDHFARGLHFVGYWHTHPEKRPTLSGQDHEAFRALVDAPGVDLARVLLIVVGNEANNLWLDVNVLDRRTGAFERLAVADEV